MPHVIIYQSGCAIFGCGPTLAEAMADAAEWTECPLVLDLAEIDHEALDREHMPEEYRPTLVQKATGFGEVHGKMYWRWGTDRLAAEIKRIGADAPWCETDEGWLDLCDHRD